MKFAFFALLLFANIGRADVGPIQGASGSLYGITLNGEEAARLNDLLNAPLVDGVKKVQLSGTSRANGTYIVCTEAQPGKPETTSCIIRSGKIELNTSGVCNQ